MEFPATISISIKDVEGEITTAVMRLITEADNKTDENISAEEKLNTAKRLIDSAIILTNDAWKAINTGDRDSMHEGIFQACVILFKTMRMFSPPEKANDR